MRRFLYNWMFRPLAWAIPTMIAAKLFGLPTTWHMWVFMAVADGLDVTVKLLFPEWKATPKGNENVRR